MSNCERNSAGIAAFFDVDGTLVAKPSLEKRFFTALRKKRRIPLRNYFFWFVEALRLAYRGRLAPRGLQQILNANKAYLRGVRVREAEGGGECGEAFRVPDFFKEAIDCAARHAREGHGIILVTGTLEPLALRAANQLKIALREMGRVASVHVCATRLEQKGERWTGRILGQAMCSKAKARGIHLLAEKFQLNLAQCFAYGDSASDRWMLESVGKPYAVNASRKVRRIARRRGWPILSWTNNRTLSKKADFSMKKISSTREPITRGTRKAAR